MKKKVIITISWIAVIIWMVIIFMFSNQNSETSLGGSRGIIKDVVNATVDTSVDLGLIKDKPSDNEIFEVTKKLDFPFRKVVHISEYFILCLLVLNALYQSNIKNKKLFIIGFIFCFIYACSDEIHQSFLDRTAKFTDVLIDSCGILFGIATYKIILYFYNKRKSIKA